MPASSVCGGVRSDPAQLAQPDPLSHARTQREPCQSPAHTDNSEGLADAFVGPPAHTAPTIPFFIANIAAPARVVTPIFS